MSHSDQQRAHPAKRHATGDPTPSGSIRKGSFRSVTNMSARNKTPISARAIKHAAA